MPFFCHTQMPSLVTRDKRGHLLSSQFMSPGHLWSEKWTALSGPLSCQEFYHQVLSASRRQERSSVLYRSTPLLRKRNPPGLCRGPTPRVLGGVLGGAGVVLLARYPCTLQMTSHLVLLRSSLGEAAYKGTSREVPRKGPSP